MKNETDFVLIIEEEDLAEDAASASPGETPFQAENRLPQIYPRLATDKNQSSYAIPVWQTTLLGILAALVGWLVIERYFPNNPFLINPFGSFTGLYWLASTIPAALLGMFLGALAGMKAHKWMKALWEASQALALTLAGGAIGSLLGQLAFLSIAYLPGRPVLVLNLAMFTGWSILGLFIGLGQAIVTGNGLKMGYGIIGGLIGGCLGGLLFCLIESQIPGGMFARAAAFGVMGGVIGCAWGLADRP